MPGYYYRVGFYSDIYKDFIGDKTEFVYHAPLTVRLPLFQQDIELQYENLLAQKT